MTGPRTRNMPFPPARSTDGSDALGERRPFTGDSGMMAVATKADPFDANP